MRYLPKTFFKINYVLLIIYLSLVGFHSFAQIQPVRTAFDGTQYLEFLPGDYNTSTKEYPLIIWLHGLGEVGTDIEKIRNFGISKHIENGHDMTFQAGGTGTEYTFIVLSPQQPSGTSWSLNRVDAMIEHAKATYRVDESRIYLTGLSLGGNGTWRYVLNSRNNPSKIAAAAPIAAWGPSHLICDLGNYDEYAVWAFHGDADNIINLNRGQAMIDAYNACIPTPDPLAMFTIYAGVGHNSWDRAYRTDNSLHTPNLYEWFLLHSLGGSPSANAGSDITINLPANTATLSGSGSDSDGTIVSYQWTKISGSTVTLTNANTATLSLSDLLEGVYEFQLTVADNDANTASDNVLVTVIDANQAPTANAGNDKNITLPTNTLNLSGSGSDPDGTIATYLWTKQSGPSGTLVGETTATLALSNLIDGTYVFRLTVIDDDGASAFDEATVTVNPAPVNQPPTANAGVDFSLVLPTNSANLSGSGSDTDGTISTYLWTKQSGPSVTMTNTSDPTLSVSNLLEGIYVFRLTVTDDDGASDFDEATITVIAANQSPTANAGSDITLVLPTNTTNIVGSGSDPDGTITGHQWVKISGAAATLTNTTNSTLTVSDLVEGSYVFRLTVTDDDGATAFDDVTVVISAANQPPTVDAGADKNLTLPTNSTSLNGSGNDVDGTIQSYQWTKVTGPAAMLADQNTATLAVSNLVDGSYSFRLTVTDDDGASAFDEVNIIVAPEIVNQAPSADAGLDITLVTPSNSTVLNGNATDPDGTIQSVQWTKEAGPAATLSGENTVNLTLNDLVVGTYTFRLTATDDDGATAFDETQVLVDDANQPPIVDAGADVMINLPQNSVTLTATSSDPDGTIVSLDWTKLSGPTSDQVSVPPNLFLSNLLEGTYTYEAKVTDDAGAMATDQVKVIVGAGTPNQTPTANAGSDMILTLPTNTVNITGSGSDPDGTIQSYLWTKSSGPAATLSNQTTAAVTVSNLLEGIYVFSLQVTDNEGANGFDEVTVTVNAATVNQGPVADAGPNITFTLPVNSTNVSGSGSDVDGSISAYLWTKVSGPSAILTNGNTPTLSLSDLVEGTYVFRLRVTDDNGATDTDDVTVTVQPATVNQSPVANAGVDQIIELPINSTTVFGSASDPDGTIVTYNWTQISGPTATLSGESTPNLSITDMVEGTYSFRLMVIDDDGASDEDGITITIQPESANLPPTADAGVDKVIFLPMNSLNVVGTGNDPDGTISTYLWEKLSGPTADIVNQNQPTLSLNNLVEGIYTFRLNVTDDGGASASDDVAITVQAEEVNQSPTANAGTDIELFLPENSTELNGSGSDIDGTIVSFLWDQLSGPALTLNGNDLPTLVLDNLVEGIYTFQLTVTDDEDATATDEILVTVFPEGTNMPPIADAGPDRTVQIPDNTFILDGSGSDEDGTVVSFFWEKVSGPSVNLTNNDEEDLFLENLPEGVYIFQLEVTDDAGTTSGDLVTVIVLAETVNKKPEVDAGDDLEIDIDNDNFVVKGNAVDADGTILSVLWTQELGGNITLQDENTLDLKLTDLNFGIYVFRLTATDDQGATAFDEMELEVKPEKTSPTANAGKDLEIDMPVDQIILVGSGIDNDGIVVSREWNQIFGPPAILSDPTQDTLIVSNLTIDQYVFEYTVTDDDSLKAMDQVEVIIIPEDGPSSPVIAAAMPRIFTPNGDGIDDFWVIADVQSISQCNLVIYSKFGRKVFEANPYQNDWDGTFNGEPLEPDAYYYVFTCDDGNQITGGLRIIR